jgi:CRISPR system Cascade subunit CasB
MKYEQIYKAYCRLSNGDQATLKRCNLITLATTPAYYRILKLTELPDTKQVQRILFLLIGADVSTSTDAVPLSQAMHRAGVKEAHIVQMVRSGDNGLTYLKRQLRRCQNIQLKSLGSIAEYWGEHSRRTLLKDFILSEDDVANKKEES